MGGDLPPSVVNLREFPTPVILDQAREGAALRCKNETTFRGLKVAQVCVGLTGRFARNGGYGSIEENEILNLSPGAGCRVVRHDFGMCIFTL